MLQTVFNYAININHPNVASRFQYHLNRLQYYLAKKIIKIISNKDSLVVYSVDGIDIKFPPQHGTPYEWKFNREYSKSLGRIAKAMYSKYPDSTIIDAGANVGDSAAIIRSAGVDNLIISIEGFKEYYDILCLNAKSMGNVVPVSCFLDSVEHESKINLRTGGIGNTVIYEDKDLYTQKAVVESIDVKFRSLKYIIDNFSPNAQVKLLKTDIEGYDIPVINGSMDIINQHKPIIFFELHISSMEEKGKGVTWRELFSNLKKASYKKAMFWRNSNEYELTVELDDDCVLEDVIEYYRNRKGLIYADVCVIHESDLDLAEQMRKAERLYALKLRPETPYPY